MLRVRRARVDELRVEWASLTMANEQAKAECGILAAHICKRKVPTAPHDKESGVAIHSVQYLRGRVPAG